MLPSCWAVAWHPGRFHILLPEQDTDRGAVSAKYGCALLRDAATNAFREFWPDIAVHVHHRHP